VHAFGTTCEDHGGRLARITDRTGVVWAELTWAGDELTELRVPGAGVGRATIDHPVLGRAHPISRHGIGAGPPSEASRFVRTVMSAVDWAHPAQIPAIAAPARIPAGAGGAILNVLAITAGARPLRYAGPYPTSALYHALLRSFTTTASEAAFTADGLARALRGARDELPFDFVPAPHERIAFPRGHAELRTALERVVIDGLGYVAAGSPTRLVDGRAEVWFGDAPWAHVATFAPDGALLAGPHPLPACTSDVLGKEFAPELREALGEVVAEAVPAPLAAAARAATIAGPIRWADLGARAAARVADGFEVHAAIWERLKASGLTRVALALGEALAPVVTAAVVADVGVMSPDGETGAILRS